MEANISVRERGGPLLPLISLGQTQCPNDHSSLTIRQHHACHSTKAASFHVHDAAGLAPLSNGFDDERCMVREWPLTFADSHRRVMDWAQHCIRALRMEKTEQIEEI